jgi:cell division protein FtsN
MSEIRISKRVLSEQVESGMKRDELAKHYGIPEAQMAKALKAAGLTIRRFHKPMFELVDDLEEEETVAVEEEACTEEVQETTTEAVQETAVEETVADAPVEETVAEEVTTERSEAFPPIGEAASTGDALWR